jgi:hypothetical protein
MTEKSLQQKMEFKKKSKYLDQKSGNGQFQTENLRTYHSFS